VYRCHCEGPFVLDPEEVDYGVWMNPRDLTKAVEARDRAYTPSLGEVWTGWLSFSEKRS
jgi:hypothetical protein